ncbi:ACP S-malonyltransferase [Zavarzinia compransoris]|uniref:Malonyl CoA-acyl carrier protein transacylase n=1 Tax=Zavarzinia compransoris TaxID=1264899 RepID=A0A317E1P5_9PROT|nr:ACP S-malonyltransferase [Zavarzinia compransoris]PWR20060.1 [acyl-carrier-protein] S-malonyltransferase [Zavarzinia compransoris]TDP44819.1 [acyl-carrier-protein] S-malonyltransferase [Zavarzinia compransoris]
MRRAFTFPGQGSQAVGMGRELYDAFAAARHVFEEVDDALGEKLSALIFNGPVEDLTLTQNTQPALMAVSVAAARVIEAESGRKLSAIADFVAGHSLGEYSALAAAGAISVADAARALRIRGQAMQKAVPVGVGAMAALLGVELDVAEAVAREASAGGEVVAAANDNGGGQVVISGNKAAVERASALALERGAKRALPLPVSAPFHCPLMQPAADAMAEALARIEILPPVVPVIANVTAAPVSDPDTIRDLLVKQVTGVVRWRESVLRLKAEGVETLVEVGAGKVLTGLVKRIDKELASATVNTPADVDAFLKTL